MIFLRLCELKIVYIIYELYYKFTVFYKIYHFHFLPNSKYTKIYIILINEKVNLKRCDSP